jgi:hypothetical protein
MSPFGRVSEQPEKIVMPVPRPTPEQDAAVTAFGTGEHLVLQAGAGTGKTTCRSADPTIGRQHVPWLRGIAKQHLHDQLVDIVLPYAQRAWIDVKKPDRGKVRFVHNHYLKMWALTEPRIPADFLLLDEAQDTNPVVEQVFSAQRGHAQLVMVGDSAQAIYGWRGARDVMTGFDGNHLTLSHSFRFGEHLASEANRWLAIANAPIRLTGSPAVHTTLEKITDPDAILCRSNAGTMNEVMSLLEAGRRVALVGGGKALTRPRSP